MDGYNVKLVDWDEGNGFIGEDDFVVVLKSKTRDEANRELSEMLGGQRKSEISKFVLDQMEAF
tara:strand:- start:203 stop:391 length:189 start_codon:yes stop_codon:yes gene_type:complete